MRIRCVYGKSCIEKNRRNVDPGGVSPARPVVVVVASGPGALLSRSDRGADPGAWELSSPSGRRRLRRVLGSYRASLARWRV